MNIFKLLESVILVVVSIVTCYTQTDLIEVEREYNERSNNYKIVGHNKSNIAYVVDISFYNTNNMVSQKGNKYSVTLKPGRHTIGRINSLDKKNRPSFGYRFAYRQGNMNPKPDKKITYLLPIAPGKETNLLELSYLGEKYGKKKEPKGWYNISFSTEEGDTIFASRAGVVTRVKDNLEVDLKEGAYSYTKDVNQIIIEHNDGTYGNYSVFKNGTIELKIGDKVIPGQFMGITSGADYGSGFHLRFSVYHYDVEANKKRGKSENYIYEFITPKFLTLQGKDELVIGTSYTGIVDKDIIMDEMSRREKKKWKKKNPE